MNGAANFNDNSTVHAQDIPNDSLKFFWGQHELNLLDGGLTYIKADETSLTLTYIQTNGKDLYQKTIFPRKINAFKPVN